jgi:hypothetical protein
VRLEKLRRPGELHRLPDRERVVSEMLAHRGEEWGRVGPLFGLDEAQRLLPLGRRTWHYEARAVARIDGPETLLEALIS